MTIKNNISGENPEHRDFIYNVTIPFIEKELGYKVIVVRSDKDLITEFNTVIKKVKSKGKIRVFPLGWKCYMNRDCKVCPIYKY